MGDNVLGEVTIEIIEGKDLIAMDSNGTSDPYVICVVGTKKKKTKIIRDTLNPLWNVGGAEIFKFKIRNNIDAIVLECYDWDRFNTDDRMGMINIPISSIKDEQQQDKWLPLVPMKPEDEVSGQLHYRIRFTSFITQKHEKNPLVIAIKAGDVQKVVSLLADTNVNPNSVDSTNSTPLHLAAVGTNNRILSTLLNNRRVQVIAKDNEGNTPLHVFAQKFLSPNNCEETISQFTERGVDINVKNTKMETPLHKACLNVSVKVVMAESLLKKGAKVNEANVEGDRPIDFAIKLGREDLVDLLVKHGAEPKFESQIELAKKLKFARIADKLRALSETFEWFKSIGLEKVGTECVKNHVTKDLLPQLKDSDHHKMGFASSKEKETFKSEVGKLQQGGSKRVSIKFKEKLDKLNDEEDRKHKLGSLKYVTLDTENWVIDFESLEFSETLGKGASGQVYSGYYGGKKVAIKTLPSTKELDAEFEKEFQIINFVNAPHIVRFFGACIKPRLCIVMEYCQQGSLHDVLKRPDTVGWDKVFNWALGTVKAIHSLHNCTPSIMHRDLKSLNVLVTADGTAKVCDFGLSRFDTSSNLGTMLKLRGTYHYVSPELYTGKKFTFASDIYSIGIILWELVNRCITQKYSFPFSEYPNLTQDFQVLIATAKKDVRPTIPPTCPEVLKNIILKCYSKNPEERPTTTELLDSLTKMNADFEKDPVPWDAAILPLEI